MALDGWKRRAGGGLAINPIVGYETAAMTDGMAGLLRVEFALDPGMTTSDAVQLVATPKQIEDLILALRDLADNLKAAQGAGRPQSTLD